MAAVANDRYATAGTSRICHLAANFGGIPVFFASDGRTVVDDYSSKIGRLMHFHSRSVKDCITRAVEIDGLAISIFDEALPYNYYHWTLDWLPRLAFLGAQCRKSNVFVITPRLLAKFQRASLHLCGFSDDRIIEVDNFTAIKAQELVALSSGRDTQRPAQGAAPWALAYLRSTLGLGSLSSRRLSDQGPAKLYISREDAGRRQVNNEKELAAGLAAIGYRTVTLSTLPLVEQIAMFSCATHVVSLHGAGLSNFAFSRYGARLVEILPFSYGVPHFYVIAAALENDYMSYVAEGIVQGHGPRADGVTVDTGRFLKRCGSFLL